MSTKFPAKFERVGNTLEFFSADLVKYLLLRCCLLNKSYRKCTQRF